YTLFLQRNQNSSMNHITLHMRFPESVWVWKCSVTRGRICPNQTETDFSESKGALRKGTNHFWSIPLASFHDAAYHFRVSIYENKMVNCGLLTIKKEPVPLKHIEVDLQVQGHVATVTSTLQYKNEEEHALEAIFVFPMPSGAAVCHFSVKIADVEIVAKVQEKQEAREQYDDALSSGEQAFLMEESEESMDVFRLSVGSLSPHQSAAVTFIYIIELSVQADHSLQFCLPAVLNPRYSPAGTGGGIVSEITSSPAGIPYSLSFTAEVSSPNPITKVESKCPLEPLTFLNTEHTKAKVSLSEGHKFDRDVELYVYYQNPHELTAIVESGAPEGQPGTLMGDPAVMVSFYPEFPESVMSSTTCGEFVFVMDRSGSMDCSMHNGRGAQQRIKCAKDTLLLLLKSLPMGSYFNVYGFGSRFESFFPKSVQYSQDTMEQAVERVNKMQANMGGTEILQPLIHIYKQSCIPNHPKQLFIFTDGEVGNTKDVLHLVRENADFHRCFSFGIGEGASSALITGLAENGSGHAQFISGTDRMQAKVMQSLHFALQPAITDISEDWTDLSFTRLSPPIKTLFHGQRALIYAQLKGEECQKPEASGKILVRYHLGDQELSNTVHFSLKPIENRGLAIHRLGARSLIRSLEREEQDDGADKEALKARVVELSKQSGVSSSHTAFIAVNKGSGQAVKGPLVTRRIPTPRAAVCQFSAKIADQEIVAELQEKQEAREQYDDALSSGQQAFLLEESEESVDVFRLSVGSLPPHQSAAVTFIYIIELSVQADHSLQFCLPAVLNPRYIPTGTGGSIVSEITSSSAGVPYSLSFTAHVSSPNPIAKVESKCPLEPLTFLNTEHTKAKVSLSAGHKFDRDVELNVYYQNPHQLTAIMEAGAPNAQPGTLIGDPAVMISFYPEFPESVMSSIMSCGEFVFVMDRSGSMGSLTHNGPHAQERIACARETLLLLLKSLPMGCYFNIYGFGSQFESFFPESVQYSQDTMAKAVTKVKEIQADMGGTEILQPLEHIYKQSCIPNHPRQLFIFTDGEVGNTRDVLHCVKRNADVHRCFSFGIGEGASSALIAGMAENGSGHAQFITGTERMQAKVMQSLLFALQPAVTDIVEDWTGLSFTRLSPPIKTLFHGQRALIYAQLKGEGCQKPEDNGKITVLYRLGEQGVSNTVHFSMMPIENSGLVIHKLGARCLIRSMEREEQDDGADKEALKARVVELSKQSGVSSSHTAFIAVNKGSGQSVKGPLVTRRIPTPMFQGPLVTRSIPTQDSCYFQLYELSSYDEPLRSCSLYDADESVCNYSHPKASLSKKKIGLAKRIKNWFGFSDRSSSVKQAVSLETSEVSTDPLLQIVSLQEAVGCWQMESSLAEVFGVTKEEMIEKIPEQVKPDVWATLLALIWLHGFKIDAQIEWQCLAMKAVEWLRTQK
ncbi:von Willebrand factor A domain-containing protein 5A-like isoform X1, partial [Clarias magur]